MLQLFGCGDKIGVRGVVKQKVTFLTSKIRALKEEKAKYEAELKSNISAYVSESFGLPKKTVTSYVLGNY